MHESLLTDDLTRRLSQVQIPAVDDPLAIQDDLSYRLWFLHDAPASEKVLALVDFSQYVQIKPEGSAAWLHTGVEIKHITSGKSVRLRSVLNLSPSIPWLLRGGAQTLYDVAYPDIASLPDVATRRVSIGTGYQEGPRDVAQPSADVDRGSKAWGRVAAPSLLGATLGLLGLLQQASEITLVHALLLLPAILACASFTMAAILQRRGQSRDG